MMQVDPKHAKQRLLFYISDAIDREDDVAAMHDLVNQIAASREWVIGPPVFLNESEEDAEAGSLRTVGGFLELYSTLPPWGDALPREVDREHFDEVKAIISALAAFSKRTGHEIAFELDGAQIGWIENGVVDNSLREGLLEEWEKSLM
jgi:hypothetical protein